MCQYVFLCFFSAYVTQRTHGCMYGNLLSGTMENMLVTDDDDKDDSAATASADESKNTILAAKKDNQKHEIPFGRNLFNRFAFLGMNESMVVFPVFDICRHWENKVCVYVYVFFCPD